MSLKLPRNWDFSTFKAETSRIASSKSVMPGVGGTTQGPPCFSKSMEKPVKAGWLKKQRSLVKNWQLRYFVLRGSTLTYHKDGKESTVQGAIQLRFCKINELPPNSDDSGKYLFEIVPRSTIDRERCPNVFMANSQSDMEEWVRTLRRVVGVQTSGVIQTSTRWRHCSSCTCESCQSQWCPGLSTRTFWIALTCWTAAAQRINYNLLSYVCRFLFEVQRHSAVNKMTVENLATVMGINLLKPQIEDPITVMKATPHIQKLMTVMIRQHEVLFPPSKDLLPSPPSKKAESKKSTPRSFVGWESAEIGDVSLSEYPEEEEDIDSPATERGTWIPQTPRASLFSPTGDDWHESPRKRTQTLPTFTCPLIGMPAKADAISRWSHIQECSEEKSGGTLSEDIFKILDLKDSGGSLFGGTHVSNKKEQVSTSRRGSEDTGSSITSPQKTVGESQHCPLTSSQKSVEKVKRSDQQVNSQPEMKQDDQLSVNSLQQENKELKATVAELQSALEAQRRRASALEICLRNAECSRDEAQRRNEELQRDVQQFLNTKPQAPT
ncbi:rho GTPase-activating protein 25-like isoform X2 [Cynoglossus semilaevis]|uniref:rho GTPase-activating protein 25-like isoform X2 n=1 Tax=Cynoglossus semilaevis TaxID=244447 RepID=UPI000D625063|nr:rho GTPase-activating protein 25-like isoform X2 [Cynoglossus semilaevis]